MRDPSSKGSFPTRDFDEGTFEKNAASFENPDFVDSGIHSQHRHGRFHPPLAKQLHGSQKFAIVRGLALDLQRKVPFLTCLMAVSGAVLS